VYIKNPGSPYWPIYFTPTRLDHRQWLKDLAAAQPVRAVRRQHLVSQAILRQFEATKGGGLASFRLEWQTYKEKSTRSCGYLTDWVRPFSGEIEQVWNLVENHIQDAMDSVKQGSVVGSSTSLKTLKHAAALHHFRSFTTRHIATRAAESVVNSSYDHLSASPAITAYFATEFQAKHGRRPRDEDEIRKMYMAYAKDKGNFDPELILRRKLEELFIDSRRLFEQLHIEILTPPIGRKFVIGDTPVALVAPGGRELSPDTLSLFAAKALYFPIHSEYCIKLPTKATGYVPIGYRELDEINERQIRNAYRYVYFTPDLATRLFVERRTRLWKPQPEIAAF
jgi:hypothetical protein